jgi:sugar lactone lactonase YvrE
MSSELTEIAGGLGFLEAPRWHEGELWFSDFHSRTVTSMNSKGDFQRRAYIAGQPSGLGFNTDGSFLVVSTHDRHLYRCIADAKELFADLSTVHRGGLNDMFVDSKGRAYVSAFPEPVIGPDDGSHMADPTVPLFLVQPDGGADIVAEGLQIPNGIGLTADGSTLVVAETLGNRLTAFKVAGDGTLSDRRLFADVGERAPDGICLDANGGVWFGSFSTSEFVLVEDGGRIAQVIETPGKLAVACALGGADGRTLYCITVDKATFDFYQGHGTGSIEMCHVDIPAIGA